MKVEGPEAAEVNLPAGLFTSPAEGSQEEVAALVRAEHGLAVAAAVHGGLDGAGMPDSEFCGHVRQGMAVAGCCQG
jgi:hypothetical protein